VVDQVQGTMRQAAQRIADYVADAAEMRVETRYISVDPGEIAGLPAGAPADAATVDRSNGGPAVAGSHRAAMTVIKLDGDCLFEVPVRKVEGTPDRLEFDQALLDLHERNVAAATEYRARILNALIGALGALPSRIR
jgi:hypothetical protein